MAAYITRMAVAMLVVLPVYLLVRRHQKKRRAIKPGRPREVVLALFVMFCAALAILLFDGFYPWHYAPSSILRVLQARFTTGADMNFVPFHMIRRYIELVGQHGGTSIFGVNLIGNMVMFVPLGFGLPLLWQRWQRWWKLLLCAFVLPVCIETLQLVLPRSVDVDDVLLNAAGILLGWALYCLARRLWPGLGTLAAAPGAADGQAGENRGDAVPRGAE